VWTVPLGALTTQQLAFFVILVVTFGLLLTERLRNDVVAILIVLALVVSGVLTAEEAVAGFASEPALVVAAIFVLGAGLHRTGVSDRLGTWIGRLAGGGFTRAVTVLMASVALLSAVTHHVTTTAVLLPVTLKLAHERKLSPSKLLLPLSFAASLGTTITIIGAPAFLIASALLQQAGRPRLGIFSIAPIGLALTAAGILFVVLVGRWLIPDRKGTADAESRFRLKTYFTEVKVLGGSPLLGRSVAEVEHDERYHFEVTGWLRGNQRMKAPYGDRPIEEGDVLLVRTTPEELVAFRSEPGLELHPVAQYDPSADGGGTAPADEIGDRMVQVIVAPGAEIVGRSIRGIDFRARYGALVFGLWRRTGWIDQELARITLRAGDVLLVHGDDEALGRIASDPSFLMMVPFQSEPRVPRKAPLAALSMIGTVIAASLGAPLEIAMLAGAAAMVLSGCLTANQAYRAIDPKIFVFIAGAIPLGAAMEASGASALLAAGLQQALEGWSQFGILLALFGVVAVITQFMSDAATTALVGPVAIALAQALGHPPEAYVVTVAMAAVTAFLTPIGHHGNLLIYGPGGYRFSDFVVTGAPLTVIVALIVTILAPLLWPA
jgi:di/tricarboxylate transporter